MKEFAGYSDAAGRPFGQYSDAAELPLDEHENLLLEFWCSKQEVHKV